MLDKDQEDFNKLSDKEKLYHQAERLLFLQHPQELNSDNTLWWNKVRTMTDEELKILPQSFVLKFGSFINRIQENKMLTHLQINKSYDMYNEVKKLGQLQSNAEKELIEQEKEKLREGDTSYRYELEGYMSRQPRLDLSKYNYNFEQFREYTALYEECRKRD